MAQFDELLKAVRPEDNIPEDFLTGARQAYDRDFQGQQAAHEQLKAQLAESERLRQQEVTDLKAQNFELLMSKPSSQGARVEEKREDAPDISGLFRRKSS